LEPRATYGWRLIPEQTVRLRWASYDYTVTSNDQGFPAPSYPKERAPDTFRIMTIGDAFTSAEGVDTALAWPRLLEQRLRQTSAVPATEVLNYAVTGYGPNQYAAVLRDKIPEYRPDLVLVACFVNDFFDVQTSIESLRKSIGFDLPSQSGLISYLQLSDLSSWFLNEVKAPLRERLKGDPDPNGYFLGNFAALEVSNLAKMKVGAQLIGTRLEEITRLSEAVGARVMVALTPAPVQICGPGQLDYYPRGIDLSDANRFSLDQPQLLMEEATRSLGVPFLDLRGPLREVLSKDPYQPRNMHFMASGHEAVSAYLADEIVSEMSPRMAGGQAP
jgi:lysophospholipase L1-like esterase